MEPGSSGSTQLETRHPPRLLCPLASRLQEDELADLGALLDRLGREVFLRGLARPRFRLLYDPSGKCWAGQPS